MRKNYKIVIIGMGYVGLSNAILLAQDNEVVIIDIVEEKVRRLNQGISPIAEKEIEIYLESKKLNLRATIEKEYGDADFIIIATPTNYDSNTKQFDSSSVEETIKSVLKENHKATIIIKSTVAIGYTMYISKKYHTKNILFSPEFLREGKSLYDNLYPSRIVIGIIPDEPILTEKAHIFVSLLKYGALKKNINVLYTEPAEAEAIKLFSNAYLALRVSFFNELDSYAESKALKAKQIIEGVCLDSRIGDYYNNPSFGYGGYCLTKDTKQLCSDFNNIPNELIKVINQSNETRKKFIAEKVLEKVDYYNKKNKDNIKQPICTLGIYRLAMKTNSDNCRDSCMYGIIEYMKDKNVRIIIYDPLMKENFFQGNKIEKDIKTFKISADIIIANRMDQELLDISEKVYTRDIYTRD